MKNTPYWYEFRNEAETTQKGSFFKKGELKQSAKNSGPNTGNLFCRKPDGTLGSRCEALGNSWIKARENIRTLDGKGCSSGLMTYFCKGIQT